MDQKVTERIGDKLVSVCVCVCVCGFEKKVLICEFWSYILGNQSVNWQEPMG